VSAIPAPLGRGGGGGAARSRVAALRADAWTVRFVTFCALALFAATHWAAIIRPAATGKLIALFVAAVLGGLAAAALLDLDRRRLRWPAAALTSLVALAAILALAGTPGWYLRPAHWDALATGLGNGLGTLPALRMPYRGTDMWVLIVLIAGGGLLLLAAAVLALKPRPRRFGAAGLLTATYATAVIERRPEHPYLDGLVFAILLSGFLWGDRLRGRGAPAAAGLGLVAILASALLAPHIASEKPWVDYEAIAESLQAGKSTTFSWNHSYAPLTWPRNGLELARVSGGRGDMYMKTVDLEDFDGRDWVQARNVLGDADDTEISAGHHGWTQTIHVEVKGLKSLPFIGAGTTLAINHSSRHPIQATPGTWVSDGSPLKRGDGYDATVYYPQPGTVEMHGAGTQYPSWVFRQLSVSLPRERGFGDDLTVQFAPFHSGTADLARGRYGFAQMDAATVLADSPYAREYRLAKQLADASTDPYDLVQNVMARVNRGARYTETPPPPGRLAPLDAFLFRDHAGYCQHFSGATALLLRMAGVPARVVSGFAPGSHDGSTHVLRDYDAHSWVEVYFPHIGWVTFDPTPGDSPARGQQTDTLAVRATTPTAKGAAAPASDRTSDPTSGGAAAGAGGGGSSWTALGVLAVVIVLALVALVVALVRRHRMLVRSGDPELEELRLALVRSGRDTAPDLTLQKVEALLAGSDGALAYVRALRVARYGSGGAAAPTPGQRRALRHELAAGLGLRGRLRALWALPPRSAELLEALRPRRRRPYTA
jgi:transglutaminase-like putative cysteine protease